MVNINLHIYNFIEGSFYCDYDLLDGGFYGEKVESASVVAIKSHEFLPTWTTKLNQIERGGRWVSS